MNRTAQMSLFGGLNASALNVGKDVENAILTLSLAEMDKEHGSIYTKPEVVDFILNLSGYKETQALFKHRVLEPSFGGGHFLIPVIDRLIDSSVFHKVQLTFENLNDCIRSVELHQATFDTTKQKVINHLRRRVSKKLAEQLANTWLVQGDFLVEDFHDHFDFVVGNPPYVRQELIPAPLLTEYKARYETLYDRADLYVPFIERSLSLLNPGGTLGFICSDRWMKNRYGEPLRAYISRDFHLAVYVDMVGTNAFSEEVSAYPAITVFRRSEKCRTAIVHRPEISHAALTEISDAIETGGSARGHELYKTTEVQIRGKEPWILESSKRIDLLRRIERDYPLIEEVGCRVGIGVATGSDKSFIAPFDLLPVETDRKLPLVTTKDIVSGEIRWQGLGVINPFSENGGLVDLEQYPQLKAYLEDRKDVIKNRHCAQKHPDHWYRTIDRIWPELTIQPKLLIPDIKEEAHIVYDHGEFYPHHNLYFITSDCWDLRALQAVLLSRLTRLFIATYSTSMRGGYLRFQAQYLRRLRLPAWDSVDEALRKELRDAAESRDLSSCNKAVCSLFAISSGEREELERSEN